MRWNSDGNDGTGGTGNGRTGCRRIFSLYRCSCIISKGKTVLYGDNKSAVIARLIGAAYGYRGTATQTVFIGKLCSDYASIRTGTRSGMG